MNNSYDEIKKALANMKRGEELTIYGIDGTDESVIPNLGMGVICETYFDSANTTYLCGVYGSDNDFTIFRDLDYDYTDDMIEDIVDWFIITASNSIGSNFKGLSLVNNKP